MINFDYVGFAKVSKKNTPLLLKEGLGEIDFLCRIKSI